ncbi:MAG: EAL and HDOD domain-containing protein [Acidobacteriota bacterium]
MKAAENTRPAVDPPVAAEPALLDKVSYLSRQPILDRRGAELGYELHFHAMPEQRLEGGLSPVSRGMLDTLALFGVERFTGGALGFVACTQEVLTGELLEGVPTEHTVLEIPPFAELSPKLVRSIRELTEAGFKLALAGYGADDPRQGLLPVVDYVKVDIAAIESPQWGRLRKGLYGSKAAIVAENIHSHAGYGKARAAGLQYFQGYYFCHPELIPNGKLPAAHAHRFEILQELFRDPLDLKALCPLVSRDPSLVYRVLRFANSPVCALRSPVTSVESAIMVMGDAAFRRIATLAIQCTLSQDQSPELLRMALLRASFCAQAAPHCGLQAEEMYLMGMLSLLPAMLQVPMNVVLEGLPLREPIREALAGRPRREGCLLAWLEDVEANNIAGCEGTAEQYGLDTHLLAQIYLEAMDAVSKDVWMD